MNEGSPRHQLLQPPLSLVAHLPVIEYANNAYREWKKLHSMGVESLRSRCSCTSDRHCADCLEVETIMRRVSALLEQHHVEPDMSRDVASNAIVRRDVADVLDSLARLKPVQSLWLRKRYEAFRDSQSLIRSPWPPPALYDFLLVQTDYALGADQAARERLSIEVPAIDPQLDRPFEPNNE